MNATTEMIASAAAPAPAKAKKKEVVKISVKMTDGRTIEFPETQSVRRDAIDANGTPLNVEGAGQAAGVRFDFKNGETRTLMVGDLQESIVEYAACHGLIQKIGDEWAGAKDEAGNPASIEDIVLICDEIMNRLRGGDWATERKGGDSLAGASIVIQAMVAVSHENGKPKTAAEVKAYLDGRLADLAKRAEAAGQKAPTRAALYQSYRKPGTKVAEKIAELEAARAAKNAVVDADAEMEALMAA